MDTKKYYLDYASTTPLDPRVFEAMQPYFADKFGNSSNLYALGRIAKKAIEAAAGKITPVLGCDAKEFIFTGSATESNNIAILGISRANRSLGNKIIVSNIEHKSVLAACDALINEGFEIVKVKVDKNGLINPKDIAKALDKKTILISITCADNETGTIQPINEIYKIIKGFRTKHGQAHPFFHTDATQAISYLDIGVKRLGVDLMTLSSHKIYGPKGAAGLYIKKGVKINPIIFGGDQQDNLRPGTENVSAIVGFGEAVFLAEENKRREFARIKKLRDKLEKGIFKTIPKVILNGHPEKRLPNFLNISALDIEGEAAMLYLDQKGISINTGSACNSQSLEPSYIIAALGRSREHIHGTLRFSLGKYTTEKTIDYVLTCLPIIVSRLRKISPVNLMVNKNEKMATFSMPAKPADNQFLKEVKKTSISGEKTEVVNYCTGEAWAYSKIVKEHFLNPRNFLSENPSVARFDSVGVVGSPACGDVMKIWLKIDSKKDKIIDCKWKTFGCASAIAATSMLSIMVTEKEGMRLDSALNIKPQDIIKRLGGLPDRKIHCSALGDKALAAAINDWFKKTGQYHRMTVNDSKIIDPNTKITELDIKQAILGGATSLNEIQKRTKVGIGYPQCLPKVKELLRLHGKKSAGRPIRQVYSERSRTAHDKPERKNNCVILNKIYNDN